MITSRSSNGNLFHVTGPLWGEFTGHRWIPRTKASDAELWYFHLCLNKRLSKQSEGWWIDTPSWSLWRHRNDFHSHGTKNGWKWKTRIVLFWQHHPCWTQGTQNIASYLDPHPNPIKQNIWKLTSGSKPPYDIFTLKWFHGAIIGVIKHLYAIEGGA